ncbi:MAG: hypothetical protein M3130_02845 [Actinomycetota bacterium]|nr:hypothetical protein [Actinomycetota bacterium]
MNDGPDDQPIGSLGEEAAKLFAAISDWANDQDAGSTSAGAAFSGAVHQLNEHLATGGEECRYCPVCQVVNAVRRAATPEVRAHLGAAATSLMQAAAEMVASTRADGSEVVRIDLDDWEEDD